MTVDILKQILSTKNINSKDALGKTAVMHAIENQSDIEIIRMLIDKGINIVAIDNEGHTALWYSLKSGDIEVQNTINEYIIEYDLNKDVVIMGEFVNTEKGICYSFNFIGQSTCVIIDGFLKIKTVVSYIRDGSYIRLEGGNNGCLLLNIIDSNILIGEGWAVGVYVKN
jgi:hypothetical protein